MDNFKPLFYTREKEKQQKEMFTKFIQSRTNSV